jgi:integrase
MTKEFLYKNTVPDYQRKNDHIILMKQRVDKYISDRLLNKSEKISQKEAHNVAIGISLNSNQGDSQLLIPIFNRYLSNLNAEFNYQPATLKYYNNLKGCLEEFGKDILKHKLQLSDFNSKLSLISFCKFLGEKRGMNDNSIAKRLNTLKAFLRYCSDEENYKFDTSVFSYKVKKYDTDVIALNFEELQKLVYLKIDNPFWQKIVDVFVCDCFMGLRISDVSRLSKADFIIDNDGDYRYTSVNKKTGTSVSIPLIDIPLTILKKYDFKLPSYTGQYFNRQLQKILKHYKLFEEEVVVRKKVLNQVTEIKVLKRNKITSHICRKTFITFCTTSLIPLNVIMNVSGLKQVKTVQAYMQKSQDKEPFKKLNRKVKEVMKNERQKYLKEQYEIENLKSPPTQRL